MEVRYAHVDDTYPIYEFCLPYHKESHLGKYFEVCLETSIKTFYEGIAGEGFDTLIAEEDGKMLGVAQICENPSFYKGTEMDIHFFYVCPEARGKGVSRLLVERIIEIATNRKTNMLYCGCHSNMDDGGLNNKLFVNLFLKYGFEETGTNLHKVMR